MVDDTQHQSRTYNILVYGIECKTLKAPEGELRDRNYRLVFEPFKTKKRFNEFDGVILFQGIFERFVYHESHSPLSQSYTEHSYEQDELDKRTKELDILLREKGFVFVFSSGNNGHMLEIMVDSGILASPGVNI